MLLAILLAIHITVCIALIGVVLIQRSEGGALGMGGGPSGFMTARGASSLLTQITWGLGATFFVLSLVLTLLAGRESGGSSVVDRVKVGAINPKELNKQAAPPPAGQPVQPIQPSQPAAPAPGPSLDNPFGAPAPTPAPANP